MKEDVVFESTENIKIEASERMNEVSSTLFIDNCTTKDDGTIIAVAENKAGSVSHAAKLNVVGKNSKIFCHSTKLSENSWHRTLLLKVAFC
jgi:Immunoglobulin I-set domain